MCNMKRDHNSREKVHITGNRELAPAPAFVRDKTREDEEGDVEAESRIVDPLGRAEVEV